ncbi:probable rRNA-processing protein EBP2 homolog [Agrilus planipennis]|uniref:Probable rRNA-processing protein EBP2 homolog n=1 Tax=Agrilus planipennis TaxID=224129 RepID=A0A1W4XT78_AGRPL|nr:probable rRNA-processing protein EBP2 homolog [Agrilus planipennis]
MDSNSDESDYNDSDAELQEAFSKGLLKPGLNLVEKAPKTCVNNSGLKQKLNEIKLNLDWVERLDCTNKEAPLAPELAAQILQQEQKRENEIRNNKKLPQVPLSEDPVLNDFKREMMFFRQGQATVLEAIPRLKALNIPTKRPDDYFAEMAKTDEHMQRIRENLMKKQMQQQRSEKVKQLRAQKKEGKALQVQAKLQRQERKKQILEHVKKVRKGVLKDLDFDDNKNNNKNYKNNVNSKRKYKDIKYGNKRGNSNMKNTKKVFYKKRKNKNKKQK